MIGAQVVASAQHSLHTERYTECVEHAVTVGHAEVLSDRLWVLLPPVGQQEEQQAKQQVAYVGEHMVEVTDEV